MVPHRGGRVCDYECTVYQGGRGLTRLLKELRASYDSHARHTYPIPRCGPLGAHAAAQWAQTSKAVNSVGFRCSRNCPAATVSGTSRLRRKQTQYPAVLGYALGADLLNPCEQSTTQYRESPNEHKQKDQPEPCRATHVEWAFGEHQKLRHLRFQSDQTPPGRVPYKRSSAGRNLQRPPTQTADHTPASSATMVST